MRLKIALYGILIHVPLLAYNLLLLLLDRAPFSGAFIAIASPVLLFSAYAVYFGVIPPYLGKRRTGNGIILVDILVAMTSELCIMMLACISYSLIWGVFFLRSSNESLINATLANALVTALWIVAIFGIQFALTGALAGLLGWYLIEKKNRVVAIEDHV